MGNDEHGPAYPNICHPSTVGVDGDPTTPYCTACYRGPCPNEIVPIASEPPLWLRLIMVFFVLGALFWLFSKPAAAMNHGFNPNNADVKWFESLQRPNMPGSCCGKGDAYPVEAYWQNADGSWTAKIGDGSAKQYPDGTTRQAIPDGTEIPVAPELVNKIDDDLDNPTDVSWIFMTVHGGEVGTVYCLIRHPSGN